MPNIGHEIARLMINISSVTRPASALVAALGVFAFAAPASASLFLDYAGGSVLSFGGDSDDGYSNRPFWIQGNFFGQPFEAPSPNQVTVSINGHLRVGPGSNDDYDPTLLGTSGVNRIAPMWMDFNLGSSGQIIENIGGGDSYYSVTWLNMEKVGVPDAFATFQAIIFDSATILNGVSFNAGDIVFSYGDISIYYEETGFPELTQTVIGLENAYGDYAALFRSDFENDFEGVYSYETFEENFPVGADEYMLFRPDGEGGYDVTIESFSPIPEPSAFAALAGGLVLGAALLRRRR